MNHVFYAIYDVDSKTFKGRGSRNGVSWTNFPTQTYDSEGRANGALKTHTKSASRSFWARKTNLVVIPVHVTWEMP